MFRHAMRVSGSRSRSSVGGRWSRWASTAPAAAGTASIVRVSERLAAITVTVVSARTGSATRRSNSSGARSASVSSAARTATGAALSAARASSVAGRRVLSTPGRLCRRRPAAPRAIRP